MPLRSVLGDPAGSTATPINLEFWTVQESAGRLLWQVIAEQLIHDGDELVEGDVLSGDVARNLGNRRAGGCDATIKCIHGGFTAQDALQDLPLLDHGFQHRVDHDDSLPVIPVSCLLEFGLQSSKFIFEVCELDLDLIPLIRGRHPRFLRGSIGLDLRDELDGRRLPESTELLLTFLLTQHDDVPVEIMAESVSIAIEEATNIP